MSEMAHENPGAFDFDRGRGFLTPRDRRFLAGELDGELNDDAKRHKRERIRNRTKHTLQDLRYLGPMDYADTQAIGDSIHGDKDATRRLNSAVRELVNYLYDLYGQEGFIDLFEFFFEWQKSIDYYIKTEKYADFTVDIEVTHDDPMAFEELAAQSAERQLTWIEKQMLERSGEARSAYEPRQPELIEAVLDVTSRHDGGPGADCDAVADRVIERTGADWDEVMEAMEDAVLTGQATFNGPPGVIAVREAPREE